MNFLIKKGRHRPKWWWLRWPLYFGKRLIGKTIQFDFSCCWDIDQVNKLFGIGFFPNHHKDSARFGWRYDAVRHKFIVYAYCYVEGYRISIEICEVVAHRKYNLRLEVFQNYYLFSVWQKENGKLLGEESVAFFHSRKLGYKLGLYFGGSEPAPDDMKIEMRTYEST